MALVDCLDFPAKLPHFYMAGARGMEGATFHRASELGRLIDVTDRTITDWVRGDSEKGRAPGRVQLEHLGRLSALYAKMSDGRADERLAHALWTKGSVASFRDGLFGPPVLGLEALLRERPPSLTVQFERVLPVFNMLDDGCDPIVEDGAVELAVREQFYLHLRCARLAGRWARSLMVISEGPDGTFLNVPGPSHSGIVLEPSDQRAERVPGRKPWSFTTPGGYRLVVIAMVADEPPKLRSERSVKRELDPSEISALAEAIRDTSRTAAWTWGELMLVVQERSTGPRAADPAAGGKTET